MIACLIRISFRACFCEVDTELLSEQRNMRFLEHREMIARHHFELQRTLCQATPTKCSFNLAQVDAQAPHLHLLIGASEIFDVSITEPPRK